MAILCLGISCAHRSGAPSFATENLRPPAINLPDPTSSRPVVAAAVVEPPKLRHGDRATLWVIVKIAPGWHIYATEARDARVATRLDLTLPHGVDSPDPWTIPPATPGPEGPAYEGEVQFARALTIPQSAQPGQKNLSCTFSFQACDLSSCRAPTSVTLDATLEVAEPDRPENKKIVNIRPK